MATVSFSIPDPEVDRVVNAFADYYAYQAAVPNPDHDPSDPESPETVPNPLNKTQFLKQRVIGFVKEAVRNQERSVAILAAKGTVDDVEGLE